jgi:hypothetical protein
MRCMKNEPLSTLEQVWALKQAVEEETRGLTWAEYFRYIRKRAPDLGLPVTPSRTRASREKAVPPARQWRASSEKKPVRKS